MYNNGVSEANNNYGNDYQKWEPVQLCFPKTYRNPWILKETVKRKGEKTGGEFMAGVMAAKAQLVRKPILFISSGLWKKTSAIPRKIIHKF